MALRIKHPEADRLARELAALTGESLTDAVLRAIRELLERETSRRSDHGLQQEIACIQERVARLPVLDSRSDEEILGYDDHGLST